MARRMSVFVGLALAALVGLVLTGPVSAADDGGIPVVPVHGQSVGHGLRLHVDVFYAKGGRPGPPGGGSVNCTDNNSQTGFAAPFAFASPITLHVNEGTVPSGVSVNSALSTAEGSWNRAGASLSLATDGSETRPAQDGTSTIGWAHLVPKNVLAATWTWVNSSNHVVEADLFYNNTQPWATLAACPTSPTGNFDVADIGTHEMGHVLGLSHYSDSAAQATMYPSAPPDEVRKVTLTAGDDSALHASLSG